MLTPTSDVATESEDSVEVGSRLDVIYHRIIVPLLADSKTLEEIKETCDELKSEYGDLSKIVDDYGNAYDYVLHWLDTNIRGTVDWKISPKRLIYVLEEFASLKPTSKCWPNAEQIIEGIKMDGTTISNAT